jgi:hypothetical protein
MAYPRMPALSADSPLSRKDQEAAKGLRLSEKFVASALNPRGRRL